MTRKTRVTIDTQANRTQVELGDINDVMAERIRDYLLKHGFNHVRPNGEFTGDRREMHLATASRSRVGDLAGNIRNYWGLEVEEVTI